jgi:hypothetical protein
MTRGPLILLRDLDPLKDVRGGSGKRLFGERTSRSDEARESSDSEALEASQESGKTKRASSEET